jgi:hypothetical protein
MNWGKDPTLSLATTVLVAVSITETVLSSALATYAKVPSGVMATPVGSGLTRTVATTVLVVVFDTLRKRAKAAGYADLCCLYFTGPRGTLQEVNEKLWMEFAEAVIKAVE